MPHLFTEMRAIQDAHGWLPEAELSALARRRNVPLYSLQGVASFYPHFRLAPPPRLDVQVCRDLSCHLAGAPATMAAIEGAAAGEKDVVVRGTSCLGRCERPTAVAFGHEIYGGCSPALAAGLVREALKDGRLPPEPRTEASPFPGLARGAADGPYAALRKVLSSGGADSVVAALKASGLKGMGGAGFPTGVKWDLVRKTEGETKYVVCNADESEPGTFKDRVILEVHADLVVEAMVIAGFVVGAERGWVYIRHEYDREKDAVLAAIARARSAGVLGPAGGGTRFGFELEVFESPGGYICGEETALLEAMEGKRAEPRNKPPFPGTFGLDGKPTLINNVETFAFVPAILLAGADWFQSEGRNGAAGRKVLALSGHVRRPGVYEVALGTPIDEFLASSGGGMLDGRKLKAIAPGGASSGFLPASMASTPLDFAALARAGSMLGSGAVVAIAEPTCMLDLALNVVRFFRDESCGKCVPCRAGTAQIVDLLDAARRGEGTPEDLAVIDDLAEAMRETSICGLGQAAPYPITSVLRHFRDEVDGHLLRKACPSGICTPTRS